MALKKEEIDSLFGPPTPTEATSPIITKIDGPPVVTQADDAPVFDPSHRLVAATADQIAAFLTEGRTNDAFQLVSTIRAKEGESGEGKLDAAGMRELAAAVASRNIPEEHRVAIEGMLAQASLPQADPRQVSRLINAIEESLVIGTSLNGVTHVVVSLHDQKIFLEGRIGDERTVRSHINSGTVPDLQRRFPEVFQAAPAGFSVAVIHTPGKLARLDRNSFVIADITLTDVRPVDVFAAPITPAEVEAATAFEPASVPEPVAASAELPLAPVEDAALVSPEPANVNAHQDFITVLGARKTQLATLAKAFEPFEALLVESPARTITVELSEKDGRRSVVVLAPEYGAGGHEMLYDADVLVAFEPVALSLLENAQPGTWRLAVDPAKALNSQDMDSLVALLDSLGIDEGQETFLARLRLNNPRLAMRAAVSNAASVPDSRSIDYSEDPRARTIVDPRFGRLPDAGASGVELADELQADIIDTGLAQAAPPRVANANEDFLFDDPFRDINEQVDEELAAQAFPSHPAALRFESLDSIPPLEIDELEGESLSELADGLRPSSVPGRNSVVINYILRRLESGESVLGLRLEQMVFKVLKHANQDERKALAPYVQSLEAAVVAQFTAAADETKESPIVLSTAALCVINETDPDRQYGNITDALTDSATRLTYLERMLLLERLIVTHEARLTLATLTRLAPIPIPNVNSLPNKMEAWAREADRREQFSTIIGRYRTREAILTATFEVNTALAQKDIRRLLRQVQNPEQFGMVADLITGDSLRGFNTENLRVLSNALGGFDHSRALELTDMIDGLIANRANASPVPSPLPDLPRPNVDRIPGDTESLEDTVAHAVRTGNPQLLDPSPEASIQVSQAIGRFIRTGEVSELIGIFDDISAAERRGILRGIKDHPQCPELLEAAPLDTLIVMYHHLLDSDPLKSIVDMIGRQKTADAAAPAEHEEETLADVVFRLVPDRLKTRKFEKVCRDSFDGGLSPSLIIQPFLAFVGDRKNPLELRKHVARLVLTHAPPKNIVLVEQEEKAFKKVLKQIPTGMKAGILAVAVAATALASFIMYSVYRNARAPMFPEIVEVGSLQHTVASEAPPSVAQIAPRTAAPVAPVTEHVDPLAEIRALESTQPFEAAERYLAAQATHDAQRVVSKLITENCTPNGNAIDKSAVEGLANAAKIDARACDTSPALKPKPQPKERPAGKTCTDASLQAILGAQPGIYQVEGKRAFKAGTVGKEKSLPCNAGKKRMVRVQ